MTATAGTPNSWPTPISSSTTRSTRPRSTAQEKTWGHSPYDYVVQIAAAAGVRRVALTHHDPGHDDHVVADMSTGRARWPCNAGPGSMSSARTKAASSCSNRIPALKPFVTACPCSRHPSRSAAFTCWSVDDQPQMLTLITRALEEDQFAVSTAASGQEALRLIDEQIPDLVVLDYRMTGMDGLAVMKTLRARPETRLLPVLMLTAMTDESSTRLGFEAGVTDYVTKPFSIPQFTARVRACLARSRLP